nr:hypothetical protein [Tanacetum cinerariifolium]
IPNNNLDHGLQALGNDADVMNLVRYIDKYRLIEGPSLNDEEDVNEDENGIESNEEDVNEDKTGSESSESGGSEDNDYIVDEDNVINEVDVDMQEFYQNIEKDVEWVGPKFADKEEATALVSCQAVATRKQLYVWKNDKLSVRAVCRGKCPNLVGPNASGLNSPSKGKLEQVNGKWVKTKIVETSCSGQGINKVDGIRIKV